ncbi:uncharacterized protein LOC135848524 [Planococcus citri]|uniref:uncharacterized protein LOC135848524 n=1 Tax=Planococcus citri TaxID=170843 RepID=UPI0031F7DF01
MNAEKSIEATADQHKPKNLIRSQYKDVMVKIEEDIYYLDRLQLALKSGYFEKLFTEDYSERNSDLIEIPLMDTDTFSAVVDVIYDEKLESVINADNLVSLLMAMDYLQMDIDPETWKRLVTETLRSSDLLNKDIFKLYNFITYDQKFEYLLPAVFEYLAQNMRHLNDHDELLSVKFDHIVKILSYCGISSIRPFRPVSKICARWIFHDTENRLHYALNLLNAARLGFHLSNTISEDDFNLRLSKNDQNLNENTISRHFYKWLVYCGEIHYSKPVDSETSVAAERNKREDPRDNETDVTAQEDHPFLSSKEPKLESFLKNGNFYDITVKVDDKVYKLHRSVLKSESVYFEEIFSKEYSELAAQCKGIPPSPPSKDKIYSLDEIDSATFDMVVNHMYLGKIEPTSDIAVSLFKAVHILRIDKLKKPCCGWMETNRKDICSKVVVEMLNFTHARAEYKKLNRIFLTRYIVDSWPKIDNLPQFAELFKAITLPENSTLNGTGAYSFDGVDRDIFKVIVDYIYFDDAAYSTNDVIRLFKASDLFKIEKLIKVCVSYLKLGGSYDKLSSADIKEVLSITLRNVEHYDDLNTMYLVQYMMRWPQVDTELFSTISYDYLESTLTSDDLYFDDPRDLLDICSTWVVHDVENRYRLVPQIALAISRNRTTDWVDYSIENPSNLKQCTPDFVKNKIWQVLCSASVLPFPLFSKHKENEQTSQDVLSKPAFVTSHEGRLFKILDTQWNEIVSFHLCENIMPNCKTFLKYPMSATMINNDTVFILCSVLQTPTFYAYNFSSGKLFCLASDRRIHNTEDVRSRYTDELKCTLLNRRNEIYCCLEDSLIMKYSFEFNRWMQISAADPNKRGVCFASDGDKLYRMYEIGRNDSTTSFPLELYDFQQNSWTSIPNLPHLTLHLTRHEDPEYDECRMLQLLHGLVSLNNHSLGAVFVQRRIFIFDVEAVTWREIPSLPDTAVYYYMNERHAIITCIQHENGEPLGVYINKLYYYDATYQSWELIKEWPFVEYSTKSSSVKKLPYGNIISIHNPRIHCMS